MVSYDRQEGDRKTMAGQAGKGGDMEGMTKDLLEQAGKRLPKYMCPNEIHCLDRMPYNANGKIDRKKLKTMI